MHTASKDDRFLSLKIKVRSFVTAPSWPVRLAARISASHAEDGGSSPPRVTAYNMGK